MSERPDSSKYKGDGSLSDFHCDTDDYIDKIETELAEARAEIERLNKNMRFAVAINSAMQEAGQDLPDLRGHECLAKHKLLSLFDFWRKRVRPRLPGFIDDEISQRDELI